MRASVAAVAEVFVYLAFMCLLFVLMGIPIGWALLAVLMLGDLVLILYLGAKSDPPGYRRRRLPPECHPTLV